MLESYFLKGLLIGFMFGVPTGVVGIYTVHRTLKYGIKIGFLSGLGSTLADVIYASIGIFGLTFISDILLKYSSIIGLIGSAVIILIGLSLIKKEVSIKKDLNEKSYKYSGMITSFLMTSFLMTLSNPMTIITFMMIFASYDVNGAGLLIENVQFILGIALGSCLWWAIISVVVNKLKSFVNDRNIKIVNKCFGSIIILFGVILCIRALLINTNL